MTVTSLWPVRCPVCKQQAEILYRPDTNNWKLFPHNNAEEFECANSRTIYSNESAEEAFSAPTK